MNMSCIRTRGTGHGVLATINGLKDLVSRILVGFLWTPFDPSVEFRYEVFSCHKCNTQTKSGAKAFVVFSATFFATLKRLAISASESSCLHGTCILGMARQCLFEMGLISSMAKESWSS